MKYCPKCNKEVKDSAKFCGGCGYRFQETADGAVCANCGNVLKPGAKFCGKCGTKVAHQAVDLGRENTAESSPVCSSCGSTLKLGAKFCGKCGSKVMSAEDKTGPTSGVKPTKFVHWSILPGQLAVRISEAEIASCGKIKGITIQPGTKALFFVDGALVDELDAGSYELSQPSAEKKEKQPEEKRAGGFWGALRGACAATGRVVSRIAQALHKAEATHKPEKPQPAISVVLVRSTEFPLLFTVKDASTRNVRSDIAVQFLCKINNINQFYAALLLDRDFVSFDSFRQTLNSAVIAQVNAFVSAYSPEQLTNDRGMQQKVLAHLGVAVSDSYPYVTVSKIVNLTANSEVLQQFQRMSEELYVSERELEHLQKRNNFLNRLQSAKNEQALEEMRLKNNFELSGTKIGNQFEVSKAAESSSHQLELGKIEANFRERQLTIYKQMELTKDEQDKFDLMLSAEKKLRKAKTEEQIAEAMHEYETSGMLRAREIDHLRHQHALAAKNEKHESAMLDLRNTQEYDLADLQGKLSVKRAQRDYDNEVRDREDAYRDSRREKDAAFADSRREKDAEFSDNRRRTQMAFEREEQQNQMDMLRQAQALRMEREDAEHRRQIETADAAHRHELEATEATHRHEETMQQQQLDAKVENQRIYAGMSFEQIMAANPDISPEAARALAQKFDASHKDELMRAREEDRAREEQRMDAMNERQMEMMRMMQQMAMSGMNANLQHQQEITAQKEAELARARADSQRNQDRMLSGIQSTVTAAGTAFAGRAMMTPSPEMATQAQTMQPPASQKSAVQPTQASAPKAASPVAFCPECGAQLEPGCTFCGECGASL